MPSLFRAGEFTIPSDSVYDPCVHLSTADITFDHATSPSLMMVTLKQGKTGPVRQGVTLTLGATRTTLCPVAAMASYLVQRRNRKGPLFMYHDGRFPTRQRLVNSLQDPLKRAGVDSTHYTGHSFRISAATTAAARGFEDSLIRTLGRWESSAYQSYIHIPRTQLASYTWALAS